MTWESIRVFILIQQGLHGASSQECQSNFPVLVVRCVHEGGEHLGEHRRQTSDFGSLAFERRKVLRSALEHREADLGEPALGLMVLGRLAM